MAYTKGKGKLALFPDGYSPCHNAEKVIAAVGYNAEADLANTPDSVFCSHGAGVTVKWYDVEKYMHVTSGIDIDADENIPSLPDVKLLKRNLNIDDKELEAIMEREFGPIKRRRYSEAVLDAPKAAQSSKPKKDYIIVDGYNLMFAWEGLADIAKENFDAARHILTDILCNYRGYTKCELVLVFDGYKVKGNAGEKSDYGGIHLVYTKENETGDMYIEKLVEEVGKNYSVRVVTSDNLIQVSALRAGVLRMPAREFIKEIERVNARIKEILFENNAKRFYYKLQMPKLKPNPRACPWVRFLYGRLNLGYRQEKKRCSTSILIPRQMSTAPPKNSAFDLYFTPNTLPTFMPAAEIINVVQPIIAIASQILTWRNAKVMPIARASILVATATISILIKPKEAF